ncbi:MAG: class I SAM-dependent methyltransferase, partial [Proteobacteria bacterium]
MNFAKLDWSTEKTKLEFERDLFPRAAAIRQRTGANSENEQLPLASMKFEGRVIAQSFATESTDSSAIELSLKFVNDASDSDFLRKSLLRISMLKLEELDQPLHSHVRIRVGAPLHPGEMAGLGFEIQDGFFLSDVRVLHAGLRAELKLRLLEYVKSAPKVGRGYLIDAEALDPRALRALNNEYSDLAWGATNWARHSTINEDEVAVIDCLPTGGIGLEVGAGSGRVTAALASKFRRLVATDIVPETLIHLTDIGPNVEALCDDIVNTAVETAAFDVAMFFENGLGGISSYADRKKAVENITSTLKPGGLLILAVRELIDISVDQLMIAAQTDRVMGIYHTFGAEEMESYQCGDLRLERVLHGSKRPA